MLWVAGAAQGLVGLCECRALALSFVPQAWWIGLQTEISAALRDRQAGWSVGSGLRVAVPDRGETNTCSNMVLDRQQLDTKLGSAAAEMGYKSPPVLCPILDCFWASCGGGQL